MEDPTPEDQAGRIDEPTDAGERKGLLERVGRLSGWRPPLVHPLEEDRRLDLTPEVEMWCVQNLRHFEVKQVPGEKGWELGTGSLVIEFEHSGDMLLFKATWGEA